MNSIWSKSNSLCKGFENEGLSLSKSIQKLDPKLVSISYRRAKVCPKYTAYVRRKEGPKKTREDAM